MKTTEEQTLPQTSASVAERVISEALARNIDGLHLCRELPATGDLSQRLTQFGQHERMAQIARELSGYWRLIHPLLERPAYGDARVRVGTMQAALAVDVTLQAYLARLLVEHPPKPRVAQSLQQALALPRKSDTPSLRELEHAFNADSHAWVRIESSDLSIRGLEKGILRTHRRSRNWGSVALRGDARDAKAVARWRDWLTSSEAQLALLSDRYDASLRSLHGHLRRLCLLVHDLYAQVALEALAEAAEAPSAIKLLTKARKPLVKRARTLSQRAYAIDKAGIRTLARQALKAPVSSPAGPTA